MIKLLQLIKNTKRAKYPPIKWEDVRIAPADLSIEHMRKALDAIEAGKITKYIVGWQREDKSGSIIITSNDLSGLKTSIRNAITEPRK